MKRNTKHVIAAAFSLLTFAATPVFAQSGDVKKAAAGDSTSKSLLGTWEGTIVTDHAPESLVRLTFGRADGLTLNISILSNGQEWVTEAPANIRIDGNSVTWNLGIMTHSCRGTALVIAGALKGDLTCIDVGAATFTARKK